MKRSAFLLAGILLPVPAVAADYPARPMSQVSAFNWTGFYAGGYGGWGWGSGTVTSYDGWLLGGQIGFNIQATGSPLVWGIELDSAFADVSGSSAAGGIIESNYFGTLRGRVGTTMDRTLLYVTGGLAWANVKNIVPVLGSDSHTHTGWTIGAGFEQDFGGGWSGKLEYLFADFGSETYFGAFPSGGADLHTIKVGLNYRFGY